MNTILAGIVVDMELYEELAARRYDIAPEWKNVPLETVILAAESKDYTKVPEWQEKCKKITEQIKTEIRKYYSSGDGRKEYKAMQHQDFAGYVRDVQKIQADMGDKAQKLFETVEKAREDWKRVANDKKASEVSRTSWKAAYLQAEEKYKSAIADLHSEMKEALDKVQAQFQEHLDDFYRPNGARIDETAMKLLNAFFPFDKAEFDRLIGGYTDNPTMIRLLDQYAENNGLRSEMVTSLGHYAKLRGKKEMEYFKSLRDFAMMAVRDKGTVPSYQPAFEVAVEKAIAGLKEIPVRPGTEG